MKKTRLLIALLVMLVAASGYAQESYRQAVKDYLTATDQFEKTKSLISTVGVLFDKKGQVDIDQLTQRYIDEQYEGDMIDWFMQTATIRDLTEADLKELSVLLSTPEYKTFETHQQQWMSDFLAELMMPIMLLIEDEDPVADIDVDGEEIVMDENTDLVIGDLNSLLEAPVQPKEDIDPAFAAKFNDVIVKSTFTKSMMDAMMKRLNETSPELNTKDESRSAFTDWLTASMPTILLNSAYGNLTLEDLDCAAELYANEPYCKFTSYGDDADMDNLKIGHIIVKYMDWMKEQGATVTEDPEVLMQFYKSLFNMQGENDESDKPWYDMDFDDLGTGE